MEPRSGEKRKYDYRQGPYSKKPRYDNKPHHQKNGNGVSRQATHVVTLPDPLPQLPPISEELTKSTFTHKSQAPNDVSKSYDRLEWLGDAYIEVASTRLIFARYKNLPTGRSCDVREMLVKNETLSQYSLAYGFDKRININPSSKPTDGTSLIKLHGDIFEAYVGAIIQSDPIKGFEIAEDWLAALWEPLLKDVQGEAPNMVWKDELRRKIGSKGVKLNYVDERPAIIGRGIETYFIGVYLTGLGYDNQHLGSGQALNKKEAGMQAAAAALSNHPLIDELIVKKAKLDEERQAERDKEALNGDAQEINIQEA
ncbi:Double-strand-specific pac1 ribonuclease [Cyphellophora attinorum]|uniref:Double-strand-specific pac1 ribonuclease n=1 Tax=Cyphellophora attinorum TaxID=1664694 RepID=A0A0N1P1C0_9EURO|nr:Double-strand-specific pac1 ribonuclease [Phialophora attinorum]KPI40415.1 Double-strand-specific pac1 ribonuclease [Phialophora attinorum]